MKTIQLKLAQVSRIHGGTIPVDGPPQPNSEDFLRVVSISGKRSYTLLVGTYKVLFEGIQDFIPEELQMAPFYLDQSNLVNIGARLTLNISPWLGVLEVYGGNIVVEAGAVVASILQDTDNPYHHHEFDPPMS